MDISRFYPQPSAPAPASPASTYSPGSEATTADGAGGGFAALAAQLRKQGMLGTSGDDWGSVGDPYAAADIDWLAGPRGTKDSDIEEWTGRGSTYAPQTSVEIDGQRYVRIGDPKNPSVGIDQEKYGSYLQAFASQHPKYGWVIPEGLATALAQLSYRGGRNPIPGLENGTMYMDPTAEALGYRGEWNPGVSLTDAPIALAALGLSAFALPAATAAAGAEAGTALGTTGTAAQPIVNATVQGAAQGAVNALLNGQNPLEGAAIGAAAGGVTGATGLAAIEGHPMYNAAVSGAMRAATQAALTGADVAKAAAMGAGMAVAGEAGKGGAGMLGKDKDVMPAISGEAPISRGQYTPADMPSSEDVLFGRAMTPTLGASAAPMSVAPSEFAPLSIEDMLGSVLGSTEQAAPEAPVQAPAKAAPPAETAGYGRYVQQAQKLYSAFQELSGSKGQMQGFDLPPRTEEMSDEDYYSAVGDAAIDYLGLDPETMSQAGLKPGTPEYLNYILDQADAILEGVFGKNADVLLEGESVEGLKAALRDLTEQEAQQLARALYVRGALGQMTSASEVVDPFTGISEQLGMLSGEQTKGAEAARQRGYARSVEEIAGLPADKAASQLRGMLGRDVDVFGLRSTREAQIKEAEKADALVQEEQRKKRKGMLGDEDYWNQFGR